MWLVKTRISWMTMYIAEIAVLISFHVLHFISFAAYPASLGVTVKCWWRKVSPIGHNVTIECQADPQGSILECDLCRLRVLPQKPAAHVSQTGCSHTSVSFSALIDAREMQNADCTLLCPGDTSLPCTVQNGCEYWHSSNKLMTQTVKKVHNILFFKQNCYNDKPV